MKKLSAIEVIATISLMGGLLASSQPAFAATTIYFDATPGLAAQEAQETSFQNDAGPLTAVSFDGFANGDILTGNEFAGLTISDPNGAGPLKAIDVGAQAHTASNMLMNMNAGFADRGDFDLDFDDAQAAGLWISHSETTSGNETLTVWGYETHGVEGFSASNTEEVVLFEGALPALGQPSAGVDDNFFFGIISTDFDITRIEIREDAGDIDGIGLEDIQFGGLREKDDNGGGPTAVPEPGTLLLIGTGLAGLVRKKVRQLKK